MIITKAEAAEKGITNSTICAFHDSHHDQAGEEKCPDCALIRDRCGCDEDMGCEDCDQSTKGEKENDFKPKKR